MGILGYISILFPIQGLTKSSSLSLIKTIQGWLCSQANPGFMYMLGMDKIILSSIHTKEMS